MTLDKWLTWGVVPIADCVLCNSAQESVEHLFFECSLSKH